MIWKDAVSKDTGRFKGIIPMPQLKNGVLLWRMGAVLTSRFCALITGGRVTEKKRRILVVHSQKLNQQYVAI